MRSYESVGYVIGAILGAVATGVCIYFTQSGFSGLLGCACALMGGQIGKSIHKAG